MEKQIKEKCPKTHSIFAIAYMQHCQLFLYFFLLIPSLGFYIFKKKDSNLTANTANNIAGAFSRELEKYHIKTVIRMQSKIPFI